MLKNIDEISIEEAAHSPSRLATTREAVDAHTMLREIFKQDAGISRHVDQFGRIHFIVDRFEAAPSIYGGALSSKAAIFLRARLLAYFLYEFSAVNREELERCIDEFLSNTDRNELWRRRAVFDGGIRDADSNSLIELAEPIFRALSIKFEVREKEFAFWNEQEDDEAPPTFRVTHSELRAGKVTTRVIAKKGPKPGTPKKPSAKVKRPVVTSHEVIEAIKRLLQRGYRASSITRALVASEIPNKRTSAEKKHINEKTIGRRVTSAGKTWKELVNEIAGGLRR